MAFRSTPFSSRSRNDERRCRRSAKPIALAVILAMCALAIPALPERALAQSASASFEIPRQTIDGGGEPANSTTYSLQGTVGQPDAGAPMTSASYTLRGGFQVAAPAAPRPDQVFADGFEGA